MTTTLDLDSIRYRQRKPYPRTHVKPEVLEDVYLLGTTAECSCFREAAIHLLRMTKEPERLVPICGAGNTSWAHDNFEGELRDVTCLRCESMIKKATP